MKLLRFTGKAWRCAALVVFTATCLLMLASTGFAAEKIKITHWQHSSPARDKMVQKLAEEFMAANPDIEIEFSSFPEGEYLNKVLVALAGGAGPDTIQVRSYWVQGLINSSVLQPLSENLITPAQMEKDFVPAAIAPFKANDRYYALPTDAQSIVLFHQPRLYDEAGLDSNKFPTTWEELVLTAKRIHRRNAENKTEIMGVATGGYAPVLFTLMRQAGAALWDAEKKLPVFDSPEAVKGMQFATDLVINHGVEDRSAGSRWTLFRNEKLGMVYAHPAMKGSFLSTHPNLQFRITEIPAPVAGGSQESLLTTWALGITSKANVEAATRWLLFHQSEESQMRWLAETGELPTRWSVIKRPEYQRDFDLRNILWSMPRSFAVPWVADLHLTLVNQAWGAVTNLTDGLQNAIHTLQQKAIVAEQEAQAKRY